MPFWSYHRSITSVKLSSVSERASISCDEYSPSVVLIIKSWLVIWVIICVSGYFLKEKMTFYILAGMLGVVMGGIQSISRSTYSKLIPGETIDTASYFSFYDITEKIAIVIGTFAYGFIEQITGNMRYSMVSMALFFIVGFIILQTAGLKKETINS